MTLQPDYSLKEVAAALGMSERWVRDRCNIDNAEHIRYGHKIRFTPEQVEKLRAAHTQAPANVAPQGVTTGRRKRAS